MGALSDYLTGLDTGRKAALAAVGALAILTVAQSSQADQFGRRALPIDSVRTARAFDDRATELLSDLVNLAHGLVRLDVGRRRDMSGAEQARKIQFSYLYEYANAPHSELKQFDSQRFILEADRRAPDAPTIDRLADSVNAKKNLLLRGTTIVDEIAGELKMENYDRAQRLIYRFNEIMDTEGAHLLRQDANSYGGRVGGPYGSPEDRKPSVKERVADAVLGMLTR